MCPSSLRWDEVLKPTFWWLEHQKVALLRQNAAVKWGTQCVPREPRTLKRDVKLSCTSPLTVRLMVFVVLGRLLHPQHLSRDAKARHPPSKPNHEILILAEMSPQKKNRKTKLLSMHEKCVENFSC